MRFLVAHRLESGFTREKLIELQRSTQTDPEVRGYRSFLNLTEGKGICIFDAPDKDRLVSWLEKSQLPYEYIWPVELEGEHGEVIEIPTVTAVAR